MPLTRVGKCKELHSISGAGHKTTEVSAWGSPADPHPPPCTLRALTPPSSPRGRGGGAGRELPSSNMAPREAGPSRPFPGFRCRAFWFRSNSALAAPSCSSSSSCRRRYRRSRNVRPAAARVEPVRTAPSDSGWGTGLALPSSGGRPSLSSRVLWGPWGSFQTAPDGVPSSRGPSTLH